MDSAVAWSDGVSLGSDAMSGSFAPSGVGSNFEAEAVAPRSGWALACTPCVAWVVVGWFLVPSSGEPYFTFTYIYLAYAFIQSEIQ